MISAQTRQELSIPVSTLAIGAFLALLAGYWAGPVFSTFFGAEDFTEWGSYLAHGKRFWATVFSAHDHVFFRPVSMAWALISDEALPLSPGVFHLRNWAFIAGALFFEYLLLLQITGGRKLASFLGCAMIATSKLQLTMVGYIAGYSTAISWFHTIACLYFLASYFADRVWWRWLAHIATFVLAMGSRDSGVLLLVPILVAWFGNAWAESNWRTIIKNKTFLRTLAVYVVLAAVYFAVRLHAIDYFPNEQDTPAYVPHLRAAIFRRLWILWGNVWNLSMFHPAITGFDALGALLHIGESDAAQARDLVLAIFTLLLGTTLVTARPRNPWMLVAIAWFVVTILPPALITNMTVYYSLEPLAATGMLVAIGLAAHSRKSVWLVWVAALVVLGILSRRERLETRPYAWRFVSDQVEAAYTEILGATNTRSVSRLFLMIPTSDQQKFWMFALTADGKSPMLQLLLKRPNMEVHFGHPASTIVPAPNDLTLWRIGENFRTFAKLAIVRLLPSTVVAGEQFNPQPSGGSAIWVDCANARYTTTVIFDGVPLQTTLGSADALTALIPPSLLATPGKKRVILKDPSQVEESDPVWFEVLPKK